MRPIPRHLTSWKPWYYRGLLPLLRRLGPERCDEVLGMLGRAAALRPGWARRTDDRLAAVREAIGARWHPGDARLAVAGNLARFSARDCTLDGLPDEAALSRFEVLGAEHLDDAIGAGRGAILLGSHFGGYLAAMHWLVRRRVPFRLMAQRPRHVSRVLERWFDSAGTGEGEAPEARRRHPQAAFFLRRSMPPGEGGLRVLRARSALLDGMAVYMNGDVAWESSCARPGTLLGRRSLFQAAWAELAVLTRAPVLPIFCAHRPGGRFALTIDPPWRLRPGDEPSGVDRFLGRLEAAIAADPADAIAHLLWPADAEPRRRLPGERPRSLTGPGPGPDPALAAAAIVAE